MVEPEPPNCPDGHVLATLAGDALQPGEREGVEAHVEGCSTCRERLVAIIGDSPTNRAESQRIAALERRSDPVGLPQTGDVLAGKYRVDSVIGCGGMGVVLGARHLELGHLVAIKVLRSRSPLATARFLREARTSVLLSGEHVVRVFDYGKLAQGSPFLVMELLQGEDLSRVIARGLVPIEAAIRYMIEICEALEEAHGLGVVHRDLKPGNLFVVYDAKGETRIKVLDFGISKWLVAEDDASALTASDAVMGSPLYMSPEQVRASRDVDLRTDIWAVGVVLYELVVGVSPFAAASATAVAVKVAACAPAPLRAARAAVTAELEEVVMRCLEKEPAARFQSVNELAEALRSVLTGYQAPRRAQRPGRVLAACAMAVALMAVVLAACMVWAFASGRSGDSEQKIEAITLPLPAVQPQPVLPPASEGGGQALPKLAKEAAHVPPQKSEHNTIRRTLDIGEVLPP